jgi:hypothetical protein
VASAFRAFATLAVVSAVAMFAAQLALHAVAWRAARTRRGCRDHAVRAGAATSLVSVLRETTLSLLVLLLWPLGAATAPADSRRGVVLVHGFASSPASLWLLGTRLRHDGWGVSVPRLGAWWGDRGTRAGAWLSVGPFRHEARPGSDTLRALDAVALPARVEAIAIASPGDALIVPAGYAYWAEACNVSVERSGHLHLLVSARLYAVIAENLAAVRSPVLRRHGE